MPVSPNKIENSTESWNDADWNLFNIIRKTVKEDQKAVQKTAGKCKRLFKQKNSPANPREVLTKLGELLRAGQDEQTLAKHIDPSKQKNGPKTPDELKESLKKQREDYEYYIQHFLPALKAETTESKKLDSKKKAAIVETILDITNRSSSVSSIPNAVEENIEEQMQLKHIEEQNNTQETPLNVDEKSGNKEHTVTSGSDSDSGVSSREPSEESLESPINSRRSSISSTLSSAGEGNDPVLSEQIAEKKPQVQENENSDGQEGKISSQVKRELKSNGKESESALLTEKEPKLEEQKKEAVLSEQSAPDNNNNDKEVLSKKQPNNRNLHVALVAGCALLAVGCLVAAAIARSGILCVIGAVFAIAAITTWCLTPSSELTSTNLSRPVDDKELTACSHL